MKGALMVVVLILGIICFACAVYWGEQAAYQGKIEDYPVMFACFAAWFVFCALSGILFSIVYRAWFV